MRWRNHKTMHPLMTKTIREIALEAPATTRVFEQFKIDYCCGGRRSIADACAAEGIDSTILMEKIDQAIIDERQRGEAAPAERRSPTELIEYILDKHHV